jgi:multimeric flavodoxin WrbA
MNEEYFGPVTCYRKEGMHGRGETGIITKRFFSAMKALGVETVAITVSSVAPSSSCFASRVAVSSEYCVHVS